jgi:hypothetical protein
MKNSSDTIGIRTRDPPACIAVPQPTASPSVNPSARHHSAPTGRIFIFDILVFFENLSRKIEIHQNLTRTTATSHEDLCIFMISRSIVLKMENISERICRENQSKHVYAE